MARVTELRVNGARRRVDAEADRSLLSVLRDDLDLTGAKYGCGEGRCGACTVLVDGEPVRSCLTRVGAIGEKPITTIEGLEQDGTAPSAPAGHARRRRDAVRLLHAGHDHGRGRPARQEPRPGPAGDHPRTWTATSAGAGPIPASWPRSAGPPW